MMRMTKNIINPPLDLKCEYLTNPIGLDTPIPRFSWTLQHDERNQLSTAYQIIVSNNLNLIVNEEGNMWDSGKISSKKTVNIEYNGKKLISDSYYYWRVKWWDKNGNESPYSSISTFGMAFLVGNEWGASWISRKGFVEKKTRKQFQYLSGERGLVGRLKEVHALYLRKEFSISKKVQCAKIYICGLGYYELRLNGEKVGDQILDPAQTDYHKVALYSTFDVTNQLQQNNALGVILGNGRCVELFKYDFPKLILQLNIHYEDGTIEKICSDETWKLSNGPIKENGIYYGETYDARLEMPGWDKPLFDDQQWETASVVDGHHLESQLMQPIEVTVHLIPEKLYSPGAGIYIYDFGQNFTGFVRLIARGPKGTEIRLRFSEVLNNDGMINTATNGNALATDIYILKGEGTEIYTPHFTYHGFRYVEMMGYPGAPTIESIEGLFFHSNVPKTGDFFCSHQLINQIHSNVLWGQLSNLMSIPTDCPQRDERQGWMGDIQLAAEEAIHNFDMARFFSKYLRDIKLSQKSNGSISDVVPPYWHLYPADPAWGTAYITIAYYMYLYYDDNRILKDHYDCLKKYVDLLSMMAKESLILIGKYGDWCPPCSIVSRKTPVEFISSWYYYHDVLLFSKIAKIDGNTKDAEFYEKKAEEIKIAFNTKFFGTIYDATRLSPADRTISQTSNTLPLFLNMVPEGKEQRVIKALVQTIREDYDYHFDTGIIGTRYIFDVLSNAGYYEIIYKMITQTSFPSYGYMIKEGATTLWERWEKLEGGGMNSHNHIMLGSVDSWFYKHLCGIQVMEPGWKLIKIKPFIPPDLEYSTASIKSIKGFISVSWEKIKKGLKLRIRLPVGLNAEAWIPLLNNANEIKENGSILWRDGNVVNKSTEIGYIDAKDNCVIFSLGSGDYEFIIQT
jgi:alpha-L-rhamnosidase